METVYRKEYIDQLIRLKDTDVIKTLVGVRRCGKSTIMRMFRDYLLDNSIKSSQIVYINFEDVEYEKWLNDVSGLHDFILSGLDLTNNCYIFLDEVQLVKGFEKLVNSLNTRPYIDLYITGSNAYLLSSELATLLTGRTFRLPVYPLSFKEYTQASKSETSNDRLFNRYMESGGMPGIIGFDDAEVSQYTTNILEDIINKDIKTRHSWKLNGNFDKTLQFLAHTVGSPVSANNITNMIKSEGFELSHNTVTKYINALTESYLFYKANRYDIKGKEILKTNEKYYIVDIAFKHGLFKRGQNTDLGHNLENIVYFELLRRNFSVYVGKIGSSEVDFIATDKSGNVHYYQVSYTVRDETTLNRELSSLKSVRDSYPKYILTMDVDPNRNIDGIRIINVVDWLLDG